MSQNFHDLFLPYQKILFLRISTSKNNLRLKLQEIFYGANFSNKILKIWVEFLESTVQGTDLSLKINE